MVIRQYHKNEVLFVEDEVMVILDGIVHMKSHTDNILPPKILAKY